MCDSRVVAVDVDVVCDSRVVAVDVDVVRDSRVVAVDVDVVCRDLLQGEHVHGHTVQNSRRLGEELVEAPALLLVRLQDVGQNRDQLGLQPPADRSASVALESMRPRPKQPPNHCTVY